jgi:hypothetical protein
MPSAALVADRAVARSRPTVWSIGSPVFARALLALIVIAAFAGGVLATGHAAAAQATATAGDDLVRLLRAMAAIKLLFAAGAIAAILWRLGFAVTPPRFAGYAAAGAAMAAGPGLIWQMAHVATGALLLHAGLLSAIVLLWRDPAVTARLADMVRLRRRAV